MNKIENDRIRELFLSRRRLNSTEVSKILSISVPTCIRIFKDLKAIRIGNARNSEYLLPINLEGLGSSWNIYQITEKAFVDEIGRLHYTSAGFYLNLHEDYPSLLGDEFKDGVFESLPWFLYDERLRGFIGRNIAYNLNKTFNISKDIQSWSDEQILNYMLNFATDLPSSFIIGERAKEQALLIDRSVIDESNREDQYPILAENAINYGIPNSSADGEQAKFCTKKKTNGAVVNVMVKFSGKLDNPLSIRMGDLLIAEHIALKVLSKNGFKVSKSELLFYGNRVFLEYERIDRAGENGQKAFASLSAIDSAFIGSGGDSWPIAMQKASAYFAACDITTVKTLYDFGLAIGNSDMHFGNLSFYIEKNLPFRLAPIYDMLPMIYAPRSDNSLKNDSLNVHSASEVVAKLSNDFWTQLVTHPRLSNDFKDIANRNITY